MRLQRRSHPIAAFFAWFLTVFLVLFPKGGFKLSSVPLTWGYLFFAVTTPALLVVRLLARPLRMPLHAWLAVAALLPMQLLCAYALAMYGLADMAYSISTLAGLVFLPWIFLLVYPPFLPFVNGERFAFYFRWCVLLAALWGILLFFLHPITGHFIEIPYLTVNIDDYGQLERTKHIARGLYLKLISTYNNGNLYGVCTLMLAPLYESLEKVRWRRWTLKLALLLTLSRTVWAGLVVYELLPILLLLMRQAPTFPRVYLGRAAKSILALGTTIAMVFAALSFNSSSLAFLFDPSLGNRRGMIESVFYARWLPEHGLYGLSEVLYTSAADQFGYAGLIAFSLIMLSPLLLLAVDDSALRSPLRRAALKGLILYAILAASDGGFNFIPTMAFYWFVYMIYLYGWPAAFALRTSVDSVPDVVAPAGGGLAEAAG